LERAVAGDHLAPAGVVGQCFHPSDRLAGTVQRHVAFEHGAHDQAFQGDPDRE
jgi:hypothetical protein